MPDISKNHEISGLPIYHGPKPSDKIKFSDTLPHDFSPIHMLLNCLFIFCMRPHVGQDRDHQSWRVENPVQNHQFGAKTFLTCTIPQRRWYHMVWYNTYSHSVQTTGDPLDPEVFLCMYLVLEDGPPTLSLSWAVEGSGTQNSISIVTADWST